MPEELDPRPDADRPTIYEIRVRGHLGHEWTDWFAGLTVTREDDGETLLTGPVIDQAALYGLLKRVRDLGLPLLAVQRVGPERSDEISHENGGSE